MKLGLETLVETANPGRRRIAILGGMGELGDESPRYHKEIAAYARNRADVLVGVGDLAKDYDADHWFTSSDVCADQIESIIRPGDCIFVKGSASTRMRLVVDKLRESSEKHSHSTF